MQRLDKLLSDAGVASRRELKTVIKAGRVEVNGRVVKSPEAKVDEIADEYTDFSDRPYSPQVIATIRVETFGRQYPAPEKVKSR